MALRDATIDDLDDLGALARGDRLMRQGWDTVSWPDVAQADARHELWLRRLLGDPGSLAIVSEGATGTIEAALIARPSLDPDDVGGDETWVVEEFTVASLLLWPTAGRALLSAAGAALSRRGGSVLTVGCPPHDRAMSSVVESSGLLPAFRFRLRSLGTPVATISATTRLPAPVAAMAPLPHSLSTSPRIGAATLCAYGGAQAFLGCRRWAQRGATVVGVADPVISSGFVDVDLAVVELVQRHLMTIGVGTSVVVSPGHEMTSLDVALNQLGYGHCLDWWSTAPPHRPMLTAGSAGQLAP